jgi:hypothetical protein
LLLAGLLVCEVFPVAKSVMDWFVEYSASLGFTILSAAMKFTYVWTADTAAGESNCGLPAESKKSVPYCCPSVKTLWMPSVGLAASRARPH